MADTPPEGSLADRHAVARDAHGLPAAEVAHRLGVDPAVGLSEAEAGERAAAVGPNDLARQPAEPLWRIVVEAAGEPFVVLLAVAGGLAVTLGEVRDGLLVLAGLLPIVGADVITAYRSDRALDALREAAAPRARVRRDGEMRESPAAALVPGDIVGLQAGDVVPADVRLISTRALLFDRSVLTGESVPELASSDADAPEAPIAERRSMAYAGTAVVRGRGQGVVTATGGRTEVGQIAGSLGPRERRRSPLQRELDRLVRILLVVAISLIVIVTTLGLVRGAPLGETVLAGISAAIAAIPEEPPILLAVILGVGAYRLLRRGVLVRRLSAQETLGSVDLILTDKTGTLTENRLQLAGIQRPGGEIRDAAEIRELATEAFRAEEDAWHLAAGGRPGSFTRALLEAIVGSSETGDREAMRELADPVALLEAEAAGETQPYSRTRARRVTAGGTLVEELALGAPESVLALCADDADTAWRQLAEASAGEGSRMLLLAGRAGTGEWAPRALLDFRDQLRPGVTDAMARAARAGIQVTIVTGDHPATAAAIASAAGLPDGAVVTGSELDAMDDGALAVLLPSLRIVARAVPEQKLRLVQAGRSTGRTVAVTGDGVNDAPALQQADVAVAMGSGSAVAREASDLVLGDDSFVTLMDGLSEGRRIVDNMEKGLVFLVSTHVALLGFILLATLAGITSPLLPLQILWLELFIDTTTSVAFEREPAEPGLMDRRPRRRGEPLLTTGLLSRVTFAGSLTAVAALAVMLTDGGEAGHARWLAFTILVCAQAVRAYANRSLTVPVTRLGRNGFLAASCVAVVVIQLVIPFVPALAEAFHATRLAGGDLVLVAVIALAPAIATDALRRFARVTWVA